MAGKLPGTAIENGSLTEDVLDPSIGVVADSGARPKISSIVYPNNDIAVTALQSNNIELVGSGFKSGLFVYVNGEAAPSVTYNNANSIFATIQPLNSGTYPLYVVNPDGAAGILAPGITSSFYPTWITNTTFTVFSADWTYQLNANSDSTITYTLAPGNTLPGGVSLSSNGLLSGAITIPPSVDTTYNFHVIATDSELQSETRQFAVTSLARIVATGGTITNVGAYRIHTFTSSGTFQVTGGAGDVEYLVIGGGGGGGLGSRSGGGGGAGGYRTSITNYIAGNSYSVVVGAGGAAAANGSSSSFDSFTSAGGGFGGSGGGGTGASGGSGGGGASWSNESSGGGVAGLGNVPSTTPSQGNNGGSGRTTQQFGHQGGGGGGAGGAGAPGSAGAGATSNISGSDVVRAAGGSQGFYGGGAGSAGPANSGNGGGGGDGYFGPGVGSAGGSGVVILRYLV
jgi:hypothetical protein